MITLQEALLRGRPSQASLIALGPSSSASFFSSNETADTLLNILWVLLGGTAALAAAFALWELRPRPRLAAGDGKGCAVELSHLWALVVTMNFMTMMSATVIIPCSYALAVSAGRGVVFSGFLVGMAFALEGIGVLFSRLAMRVLTPLGVRLLVCLGFPGLAASSLLFGLASLSPAASWLGGWRVEALVVSRLLQGWFSATAAPLKTMAAQLTASPGDLVRYNLWDSCGISCGIGCGPLVSALSIRLLGGHGLCSATAAALAAIGTVWLLLFAVSASLVPGSNMLSREAMTPAVEGGEASGRAGDGGAGPPDACKGKAAVSDRNASKKMVYALAIQFGVGRALMNSALEVTTALFLETQFGMGHEALGVAIGGSFLLCLPLTALVLFMRRRYRLRDASLFVILASLGLASSMLFFTSSAHRLVGTDTWGNVRILLFADALVFSTGYVANGIADGFAYANVVPGTAYSPENLILADRLLQGSFSRLLGPVLGRFAAFYYGRDCYALLQLCLAGVGLGTAWFLRACLDAAAVQ